MRRELLLQCAVIDADFYSLSTRVGSLTRYAFTGRYPFVGETIDLTSSASALALSREAVEFVRDRLPEEVRP